MLIHNTEFEVTWTWVSPIIF